MATVSSQTDARQTSGDQMREKPCCFPVYFNMKCQGMAFTLATSTESSSGTQGAGWVAGPTPSLLTQFQVLKRLVDCGLAWSRDDKKLQNILPGAVEILISCCLLFIFDHIPCPRQCSGNSATSEHMDQYKFLINKGLGHLSWEILVPRPTQKSPIQHINALKGRIY